MFSSPILGRTLWKNDQELALDVGPGILQGHLHWSPILKGSKRTKLALLQHLHRVGLLTKGKTDATAGRATAARRGVGRVNHLDTRLFSVQRLWAEGVSQPGCGYGQPLPPRRVVHVTHSPVARRGMFNCGPSDPTLSDPSVAAWWAFLSITALRGVHF